MRRSERYVACARITSVRERVRRRRSAIAAVVMMEEWYATEEMIKAGDSCDGLPRRSIRLSSTSRTMKMAEVEQRVDNTG